MKTARERLEECGITGGITLGRSFLLAAAMEATGLPADAFEIVECADEKTGSRFGRAVCRRGYAYKLGGGGRNRRNWHAYQVWAVVAPEYRAVQK